MLILQTLIIKQILHLVIFFQHNAPRINAAWVAVSFAINADMPLQLQGVSRSQRISLSRRMHSLQRLSLLLQCKQRLRILLT